MLVSILGFGSIWTLRVAKSALHAGHFGGSSTAYYNTTGVLIGDQMRNRPRVYGVARFNGNSGFRPDWTHWIINKVFDCESPCVWNGHNKVLFKTLLARPEKPDAYLVTVTAEQSGGIDKDPVGTWLHDGAQLISFSECRAQQEVMVVMPPYTWLRGRLGTFFMEPDTHKPWEARLTLSSRI